jgi:hypothetical protein
MSFEAARSWSPPVSDSVASVEADGFEALAASLRADARDLDMFLEVLAAKLSASFPEQTDVDREGFRGRGRVKSLSVELGEQRYSLERRSAGVSCIRARAVRGIVLKNEELELDDWIDSLSRDLAVAAEQSERGRIALEELLHE